MGGGERGGCDSFLFSIFLSLALPFSVSHVRSHLRRSLQIQRVSMSLACLPTSTDVRDCMSKTQGGQPTTPSLQIFLFLQALFQALLPRSTQSNDCTKHSCPFKTLDEGCGSRRQCRDCNFTRARDLFFWLPPIFCQVTERCGGRYPSLLSVSHSPSLALPPRHCL